MRNILEVRCRPMDCTYSKGLFRLPLSSDAIHELERLPTNDFFCVENPHMGESRGQWHRRGSKEEQRPIYWRRSCPGKTCFWHGNGSRSTREPPVWMSCPTTPFPNLSVTTGSGYARPDKRFAPLGSVNQVKGLHCEEQPIRIEATRSRRLNPYWLDEMCVLATTSETKLDSHPMDYPLISLQY